MHHKNFSLHWNFPKIEGNFSIFILLKFSWFMISRWLSKDFFFYYFYNILTKIMHIQKIGKQKQSNIQGKGGRSWEARVCQAEQIGACLSLTFQEKVNGRNREELSSVGVKNMLTTSLILEVKRTSLTAHEQKNFSDLKREGTPSHNMCHQSPRYLPVGIHLG